MISQDMNNVSDSSNGSPLAKEPYVSWRRGLFSDNLPMVFKDVCAEKHNKIM